MPCKITQKELNKRLKSTFAYFSEQYEYWIPDFRDLKLPQSIESLNEYLVWLANHLDQQDYNLTPLHTAIVKNPEFSKWPAERFAMYIGGAAVSEYYDFCEHYDEDDWPGIDEKSVFPFDDDGRYSEFELRQFLFAQQYSLYSKNNHMIPVYALFYPADLGWRPLLKNAISRTDNLEHKVVALQYFYAEFNDLGSR